MAERGRPQAERKTRGVRAYEDTAEMLAWVLKLEGRQESAADFIEPLIRAEVERRFAPLAKRVDAIKRAMRRDPVPAKRGA